MAGSSRGCGEYPDDPASGARICKRRTAIETCSMEANRYDTSVGIEAYRRRRVGAEERERSSAGFEKKRIFRYLPEGLEDSTAQLKGIRPIVGTKYALVVNSGTSALICALIGAERVRGRGYHPCLHVVTTLRVAVGAVPVLCEIDHSLTLDPEDMAAKITPRTKAIIAVHMRACLAT